MNCTVCEHPDRQAIDQALLDGAATLVALSEQYHLSTSALSRHKAHLQVKVGRGKVQLQDNLLQSCLFWLIQALEMSMQTAAAAQAEGNHRIVLQSLSQGTRLLKMLLKQDLPLDDRLVYDLLTSPQWTTAPGILPHDPQILAAGRQALVGQFTAACADTDPPPISSDPLTARGRDSLFTKRETSGKKPGKTAVVNKNNLKKQEDKLYDKIAGLDLFRLAAKTSLGPPASKFEAALRELDELGPIPADIPLAAYLYEQSLKNG